MKTTVSVFAATALLVSVSAMAQTSIFRSNDGTSGTIVDLGNGFRAFSDSHGNTGTLMDLGGGYPVYQFSSPRGPSQSGTILTPPPPRSAFTATPHGIAPPLMLPPLPNMPITPRQQIAPAVPFRSNSWSGRYGR